MTVHGKTRQTLINEGAGIENAIRLLGGIGLLLAVLVILAIVTALGRSL